MHSVASGAPLIPSLDRLAVTKTRRSSSATQSSVVLPVLHPTPTPHPTPQLHPQSPRLAWKAEPVTGTYGSELQHRVCVSVRGQEVRAESVDSFGKESRLVSAWSCV